MLPKSNVTEIKCDQKDFVAEITLKTALKILKYDIDYYSSEVIISIH